MVARRDGFTRGRRHLPPDGQLFDRPDLPISNTVDSYSFDSASKQFAGLSYPLTPFLTYAENGGLGTISPRDLDRNRKDDYVASWTVALQRTLPFNVLGTLTYLGNKAADVLTTTYANLASPVTNLVPYPAFGVVSWRGDVGNSTLEALQANVRRSLRNGLLLSANYMWSHSINDASIGGGESDTPQDSFCRSCDKASSDDDIRQMFNIAVVYQVPFKNRVWGNWQLSAIGTAQTGLPVNVTVDRANASVPGLYSISGSERPNYVVGTSLTPTGGSTPKDWINLAAFAVPASQTFGNLGRNAFRAPGLSQLDLGLSKFVGITEKMNLRLQGRSVQCFESRAIWRSKRGYFVGEFWNDYERHRNYNSAGRGTPRELQVSAKFVF